MEKGSILNVIRQTFVDHLQDNDPRTKISSLDFIVTLVFCFFGDSKILSLESMRRFMIGELNIFLAKSSFWERLSRTKMKNVLKIVLADLLVKIPSKINFGKEVLSSLGVTAIFLVDSSSISLWHGSRKAFPGTRTTAGIKMHFCFNLMSGVMNWFELTPTSTHDRKCFPPMDFIKGALVIFDLGYWDHRLFLKIDQAKAFFLSRIKKNSIITICEVIDGISKKYIGKSLREISLKRRSGLVVELIGSISIDKRQHPFRVIGFWNPTEKNYHWYLTNLLIPARVIYPLYRIRWTLELVFKGCKQSLNANQIPSNCTNIIESLLLLSIIGHILTFSISSISVEEMNDEKMYAISVQRISKIAVLLSHDFIQFLVYYSKRSMNNLINKIILFANEIIDPNYKSRKTILQHLHDSTLQACKPKHGKLLRITKRKFTNLGQSQVKK